MKGQQNEEVIKRIGAILLDVDRPLKERFRALFTLRNIGCDISIKCIENCFNDSSALLKHECAYCLGQMQNPVAVTKLEYLLSDPTEEPVVRHEAAEALAAIGQKSSISVLEKYVNDPITEVAETCQLAVEKMKGADENDLPLNPYRSVDPAPPFSIKQYSSVSDLEKILLDDSESLYRRYRAMFSLRNMGTDEAALSLAKGLKYGSTLFKHEIAYVLGQMQNKITVKQLSEVLINETEHEMVRHECAEALGSIASEECMKILSTYSNDQKRIVRESCEVALDMYEYENGEEFQYANALLKVEL